MPEKIDPDSTSDEKLLKLYMLLLFSRRGYSTNDITKKLNCSKQTVGRLMSRLEKAFPQYVRREKQGRCLYYYFERMATAKNFIIDADGLKKLALLRDLMSSILPCADIDSIERAILTVSSYSNFKDDLADLNFGARIPKGKINYDLYAEQFEVIQKCLHCKKCCCLSYQKKINGPVKTYNFAPKKIITFGDAMYLSGWILDDNFQVKHDVTTPTTLAIHRIKSVEQLNNNSSNYKEVTSYFQENFGFINNSEIKVKVKFSGNVATYISDRIWSHDQNIIYNDDDDSIILEFYSSSKDEVLSFVLSFGNEAEILEPSDLREEITKIVTSMKSMY